MVGVLWLRACSGGVAFDFLCISTEWAELLDLWEVLPARSLAPDSGGSCTPPGGAVLRCACLWRLLRGSSRHVPLAIESRGLPMLQACTAFRIPTGEVEGAPLAEFAPSAMGVGRLIVQRWALPSLALALCNVHMCVQYALQAPTGLLFVAGQRRLEAANSTNAPPGCSGMEWSGCGPGGTPLHSPPRDHVVTCVAVQLQASFQWGLKGFERTAGRTKHKVSSMQYVLW